MCIYKRRGLVFILLCYIILGCKEKDVLVSSNTSLTIIPQPKSIERSEKGLDLKQLEVIEIPEIWSDIKVLLDDFHQKNKLENLKSIEKANKNAIRIQKVDNLDSESYTLKVNLKGVLIEAADYAGAFNALQTWKQLVLSAEDNIVMQVKIEDTPRFNYRGLMLDCSRHFWTVDQLKKSITQMAFFKLNKLHLHLTDNNAWRVEIKAYPELTTKGTYYKQFPELSGKFYTQEDLKEVVAFASKHNIEVIPEIDIPGHAIGILAAYPELACSSAGKSFEVYPEEMPFKDRKAQANMLCIGNPDVYTFSEQVIKEMAAIFPSNKIHLGGDEVPTSVWKTCEKCLKLHKKEHLNEWGELQDVFTKKMSAIVQQYGKKMLGWDEINDRHAATADDIVMVWRNYGFTQATEALERDVPVIMAPQHGCYYDWGYAGNSTRKVYEWDPISKEMDALHKNELVLGGQACLWTERVNSQERIEEMLYPRLVALAEVLWSPKENRDWDNFLKRLEQNYDVMKAMGINYFVDDAINDAEFKPKKEKPALIRHAQISTNLPNHGNYHLEYVFDGRSNTFYWGSRSIGNGDWYLIKLGEPVQVNKITVITGDSKDYVQHADLLISEDGNTFQKVADFDEYGKSQAEIGGKTIRAIRIQATKQHTCWPIIKEIKIE